MEENFRLLHRGKITQLEMMRDRGYDISSEEQLLETSVDQFVEYLVEKQKEEGKTYRQILSSTYVHTVTEKNVLVFYAERKPEAKKNGVETETVFIGKMNNLGISEGILITENDISTQFKSNILNNYPSYFIQHFILYMLVSNVTKHCLQPKFDLLSEEEKKQVLGNMKVTVNVLPKISVNDPISQYYGAREGQLFKITRVSSNQFETMTDETLFWRIVV